MLLPNALAADALRPVEPMARGGFSVTVTPNFAANFGWHAPYLYGSTIARHGPAATLQGGVVDFGTIIAGSDIRYRYAARVDVTCPSMCDLYENTDADFSANLPAETMESDPSGGASFAGGVPFSANVPIKIASDKRGGTKRYDYDYILRVPEGAVPGPVAANVVYTVVP